MVPQEGIGPSTSSLPRMCSTTEPLRQILSKDEKFIIYRLLELLHTHFLNASIENSVVLWEKYILTISLI